MANGDSKTTQNIFFDDPTLAIDEAHRKMGFFSKELSYDVWDTKYRYQKEATIENTFRRVADAIFIGDPNIQVREECYQAMVAGLLIPAGRILTGAGTQKRVTLQNCYVSMKIEDSMESIQEAIKRGAMTMQQGGGIGFDWTPLRPEGAFLSRTQTEASGPIPFMVQTDSMSKTVRSAGDRRGAMMFTLSINHPDILKFITCKRTKGMVTEANLSILVPDAFIDAMDADDDWLLYHRIQPMKTRDQDLIDEDFEEDGELQYVYAKWNAKELWEVITRGTYEYSEPGVIFIDRINDINNLWYMEDIQCTNPCGEQPLSPDSACNLAHSNLARMVEEPFTDTAWFNYDILKKVTALIVRFLDNVIDVSLYPLEEQRQAQILRRLEGQGFTGLADAMHQMRIRYGSHRSAEFADRIARTICEVAYETSIELSQERGSFPGFDADQILAENTFISRRLSGSEEAIRTKGLRNGRLLSVAPVGTCSIVFGDVASGTEPTFLHEILRKVRQTSGMGDTYTEYQGWGYSARLYKFLFGEDTTLPSYMVTAQDLTVDEHILVMSKVQYWVDASVSKTINVPKETEYDDFQRVYTTAYISGCKSCATYRPSDIRGSILSDPSKKSDQQSLPLILPTLSKRPKVLMGTTYQIKWPSRERALYLTINSTKEGIPFEVFINSKDATDSEWYGALSLMITAIFRKGGDIAFVADELMQIESMHDGAWIDQKHFGSIPSYIGHLIKEHLDPQQKITAGLAPSPTSAPPVGESGANIKRERCPICKAPGIVYEQGCRKCVSCGYSECN